MLIGKKMKELRKVRKMTLTDLSRQSGVQLATLSRIENMKMTGTLQSHMDIAKSLGVSLADLYGDIEQAAKKVEFSKAKSETDIFVHSEKSSYEILTSHVLSKKMMPRLVKIDPEGKTNTEKNQIGTEKFLFVLEGKVEAKIDQESYILSRYNTLYFDASLPHCLINKGKVQAKLLSVVTPVAL